MNLNDDLLPCIPACLHPQPLNHYYQATAQSREDLRSERRELGVLDSIQQTVSTLVRERYGAREARARKMTM